MADKPKRKKVVNSTAVAKKIEKPLTKLNSLFNDLIDNIAYNTFKSNVRNDKELEKLNAEIDKIIFSEIKNLTSFTGDDISTFLVKIFNEYDNKQITTMKSIEDIFASDNNGVFQFFHDRYKNQNLLYDDLNMICSQLYELQEAISATRDAIVTSDDIGQTVSRVLRFKNTSDNDTTKKNYITLVENIEKKYKILPKLKNHIIPKTLQYGKYYVYTIPYSKLFESYYENKLKRDQRVTTLESYSNAILDDMKKEVKNFSINLNSNSKSIIDSYTKSIEIYNDEYCIPILEGTDLSFMTSMISDAEMREKIEAEFKNIEKNNKKKSSTTLYSDGTVDIKDRDKDFSNIPGCYIQLIDPRKIIPIKILNNVIGYYYIHESPIETTKTPFMNTVKFTQGVDPRSVETAFIGKLADKIVKAFDKKFLENNVKFKELIMNALTYNELYKKQIKFQFIPVDYITEFSVNEDEEGNGTSVLVPALFYAKLYLALLIFKIISIITKSNDTKIYYVKQSGIDTNVVNKIQEVARSIKEKQANFMDLLNYNSMISKIGQAKEIFMPVGKSGERGVEFDILSGQDVQLNTELMEMLRTGYINSTGTPSVIMNYINEADYARTLIMANAKFVGRVVNHQLDFNNGSTELYKKLIRFELKEIPPNTVEDFEFSFLPPKSLNNMNMSDLISNSDQSISFMVKTLTGENSNPSEDDNKIKDLLYKRLAREFVPMLPWKVAEEIIEECKMELMKIKVEKEKTEENEI